VAGQKNKDVFWKVLITAPFGEVLQTAEQMMTREQYLHYEDMLQLFRPPRDLKHKIRSRKLEAELSAYDQSLRLLYYQYEPKTKPECD
jgi:hypothetical protein